MFALVWVTLLPICFFSAFVGVLLWVWVALLSPNELLYGFMAGVPLNKIVAIVTILMLAIGREKKRPYLDLTQVLLVLLAISATVSWLNAIVQTPDGDELYQKLIKDIVLVFAITVAMTTRHRLHLLVLTIVVSLGFLAVKEGLISLLTAGGHKIIGSGSIGDNNSLATALLMTIPLTYYLARYSAVRIVRIGLFAVLGLSLVTVVMTFSRDGFIGMLVLALFLVNNSRNKFTSILLVAVAAILIYQFAPSAWFSRLNTIETADNDGSFMGRVVAWKMSWLIAMDHPFFGGGPHAVQQLTVWDNYKPLLPSLDFVKTPPADEFPHAAHSIYFEVLGDMGFGGLTIFLAALGSALWNCHRICRITRNNPALAWAFDLARMAQISLVIYMITGAALSMAYFELLYIMLALTSRCKKIVTMSLKEKALPAAEITPFPEDDGIIFASAGSIT